MNKYQFASKTRDHLFCGKCGTSVGIDFLGNNKKGDLLAINVGSQSRADRMLQNTIAEY